MWRHFPPKPLKSKNKNMRLFTMQRSIILQKFVLKQIKTVKVVPRQCALSGVKLTRSDSDIKRTVTQAKLRANQARI